MPSFCPSKLICDENCGGLASPRSAGFGGLPQLASDPPPDVRLIEREATQVAAFTLLLVA